MLNCGCRLLSSLSSSDRSFIFSKLLIWLLNVSRREVTERFGARWQSWINVDSSSCSWWSGSPKAGCVTQLARCTAVWCYNMVSTYIVIEVEIGNVVIIVEDGIERTERRASRWTRCDHARTRAQRYLTTLRRRQRRVAEWRDVDLKGRVLLRGTLRARGEAWTLQNKQISTEDTNHGDTCLEWFEDGWGWWGHFEGWCGGDIAEAIETFGTTRCGEVIGGEWRSGLNTKVWRELRWFEWPWLLGNEGHSRTRTGPWHVDRPRLRDIRITPVTFVWYADGCTLRCITIAIVNVLRTHTRIDAHWLWGRHVVGVDVVGRWRHWNGLWWHRLTARDLLWLVIVNDHLLYVLLF